MSGRSFSNAASGAAAARPSPPPIAGLVVAAPLSVCLWTAIGLIVAYV